MTFTNFTFHFKSFYSNCQGRHVHCSLCGSVFFNSSQFFIYSKPNSISISFYTEDLIFPFFKMQSPVLRRHGSCHAAFCNKWDVLQLGSPSCVHAPSRLMMFLCFPIIFIISISDTRSDRSLSVASSEQERGRHIERERERRKETQ